ncbi:MAG: hypothetical protein GXP22_06555 [Gammaproteobacteria bacterium]|nr:hypothetical protein [Gammaproteobacteria bacterium]
MLTLITTGIFFFPNNKDIPVQDETTLDPESTSVAKEPSDKKPSPALPKEIKPSDIKDEFTGINEQFDDEPRIQKMWINRGQDITLNNYPAADAADFQHTFFHRGFKNRVVTCGEVQFRSEGIAISNYQRFIYVGIQSSYLESDVINFDIFWDKLCVQTY